jgi:membrane-associated phospholipid phosphatase
MSHRYSSPTVTRGPLLAVVLAVAAVGVPGPSSASQAREPQTAANAAATDAVRPDAGPSLGAVFAEVPRDLWRFVSPDTVILLATAGTAAIVAHEWDDDLVSEIEASPRLNDALEPGHKYGSFAAMLGASFAVYGIGRVSGHGDLAVVGADLVRAQIVSQLWVQALKFTVQRERPDGSNDLSFPSGHAAGGFAAAAVLTRHYGWKAAIPAYLGATYIATARVHDNKHYLTDVAFGAAMGIAGARTVLLHAGGYGIHVAPAVAPRGVALGVTVVPPGR